MTNNHLSYIWKLLPSARLVGGCVRDNLLGKTPKDYDFATHLLPEEVIEIFSNNGIEVVPSGLQHGTVMVILDGIGYEITTLRTDDETDGRHAIVSFTDSWEKDAERRDFTFNALYMDKEGTIYDYYNGVEDLKNNIIRFIGSAEKRIKEDSLRILRYFRFMTRIDNPITVEQDKIDIKSNVQLMDILSKERILSELTKIFSCDITRWDVISLLNEYGISKQLFSRDIPIPKENLNVNYLSIFASVADTKDYMYKFKGSFFENTYVNDILTISDNNVINDEYEIKKLLIDYSVDVVISKLYLLNKDISEEKWNNFLTTISNIEIPVFPLRGQDLLDIGYKGVEIGKKLKSLRNIWIENRFIDTKKTLMEKLNENNV